MKRMIFLIIIILSLLNLKSQEFVDINASSAPEHSVFLARILKITSTPCTPDTSATCKEQKDFLTSMTNEFFYRDSLPGWMYVIRYGNGTVINVGKKSYILTVAHNPIDTTMTVFRLGNDSELVLIELDIFFTDAPQVEDYSQENLRFGFFHFLGTKELHYRMIENHAIDVMPEDVFVSDSLIEEQLDSLRVSILENPLDKNVATINFMGLELPVKSLGLEEIINGARRTVHDYMKRDVKRFKKIRITKKLNDHIKGSSGAAVCNADGDIIGVIRGGIIH